MTSPKKFFAIITSLCAMLTGHLSNIWHGILSVFAPRYTNTPFTRIVFVSGINCHAWQLRAWERHVKKAFSDVTFLPVRHYYLHTDPERTAQMITDTQRALENSTEKTLIIAHSFGGLIAKAAIARMQNPSHIDLLVTLASPHMMDDFGVRDTCELHDIPDTVSVPTLTFGGRLDVIVPDIHTHMTGEYSHITLTCTHVAFLWLRRTRKEVIDAIMFYINTHKDDFK